MYIKLYFSEELYRSHQASAGSSGTKWLAPLPSRESLDCDCTDGREVASYLISMTSTKAGVGMNMRCGKIECAGPPHPRGESLLGEIK